MQKYQMHDRSERKKQPFTPCRPVAREEPRLAR
jgi:hypothetical protein